MLKTPKLAAANLVSIQSNFPEPHTILATCALKIKSKILTGTVKKIICKNAEENFFSNSFLFCFEYAKAIAGKIAETVVTDGSFNYQEAVRKEFATYKNRNPHYRYVSIREHDSNNNNIERFHGTFRQRDKVMRGFKGNQKQYAENFKTFYNFIREHQALKGLTPAQRAGINKKADWRELLISATQHPKSNTPR